MKNILNIFSIALAFLVLFTGCQPEDLELEKMASRNDLQFEVTQNPEDPNMVILESLTPNAIPMWITPMGRSTKAKDTVRLPFSGTYNFIYNVQSGGGFVAGDTVELEITTMNLSYVDDPLWNDLTGGGPGNEKDWVLDTEAKYFNGPLSFYGTNNGWLAAGVTWDGGETGCYGDDCWTWSPDAAWLYDNAMAEGDHGVMTFSLQGGAFFHAVKPQEGGIEQEGTYFLDVGAKTLQINDASILRSYKPDNNGLTGISDWTNYTLFDLNEDILRLGVVRDNDVDGEGAAMLVYNFIAKEYSDNWVPEDEPDPVPDIDLGGGSAADLISVSTSKSWTLSPETPFDWTDLNGNLLNGWTSVEDYPDWAGFDADDQEAVSQNNIVFHSDGTVETTDSEGNEMEGTYEVDEGTNVVTFTDIVPSFAMGDWAVATTTEDNQWRIVKTKVTGSVVTDIWFGKRDPEKDEYMVFHFVLGSSDFDPIEANRQLIINSLTGPTGTRTFKVSDTWHVDWLAPDLTGGWTDENTFVDDFETNSWVWTAAVKAGLQDPTLTFTLDGGVITCTKVQDGETTSAEVSIDAENNTIDIDMDLIAFKDAASWLPTYGSTWYFCKTSLTEIETAGMWLGDLNDAGDEVTAIHYVISEE